MNNRQVVHGYWRHFRELRVTTAPLYEAVTTKNPVHNNTNTCLFNPSLILSISTRPRSVSSMNPQLIHELLSVTPTAVLALLVWKLDSILGKACLFSRELRNWFKKR